jgi:phage terminase large subunit-like protein
MVVAVDPAVTSGESSNETGIIVAALHESGHAYIWADYSGRYTPDGWAQATVAAYRRYHADRIVGEVNNGGDLIESTLRTVDRNIPYRSLHASRGKLARAEPVAALYEQKRVHHFGKFTQLEEQMCSYVPGQYEGSPDRMDAMVWALTELCIDPSPTTQIVVYEERVHISRF